MACPPGGLADGPHDERLATTNVARGEHLLAALDAVVALGGIEALEAPTRHNGEAQLDRDVGLDRPREAHGEARRTRSAGSSPSLPAHRLQGLVDAQSSMSLDLSVRAGKACRGDRVLHIGAFGLAEERAASTASAGQESPCSPFRRHRHDLDWITDRPAGTKCPCNRDPCRRRR